MKGKNLLLLFGLCAVLAMPGACGRKNNSRETMVRKVYTVAPEAVGAVNTRSFSGVVKAMDEIKVGFKTAGQIAQVYVKEGDYVKQGAVVARLDSRDYRLQLEASEIQYNQLKGEVARLEELYKRDQLAANDYEKAKAGLAALAVQVQVHRNIVSYTELCAPVSGYVQAVNFRSSEMVNAGMPVLTLIEKNTLEVVADIPAALFLRRNLFTRFSCRSTAFPGKEFPLSLAGINPKANGGQQYKIHFFAGGQTALAPGMSVSVDIEMKRDAALDGGWLLPARALFTDAGKTYVWVVNDRTTVSKREVQVGGFHTDGRVVVRAGVNGDDVVVNGGGETLQELDKVSLIEKPSETNVGGML